MTQPAEISEELKAIAPGLASLPRQMPFEVPANYFKTLPHLILAQLDLPFPQAEIPAGYLDNFSDLMLQKVRSLEVTSELKELAPTLNGISKAGPYHVPEHYFSQLNPAKPAGAPIISLFSVKAWKNMAIAASIAIFALLAGALYLNSGLPNQSATLTAASHEKTDSVTGATDLSAAFSQVDDNALNTDLSEGQASTDAQINLYFLTNVDNFEAALVGFSEADLKTHLTENVPLQKNS